MAKLKLVIFDADGTIFDTFEMIVAAYRHVSETHDLPVPNAATIRSKLGSPMREMFETFYPGVNIDPLLSTNHAFVTQNVTRSQAFAGVEELLSDLTDKGIKLAILTSGTETVNEILRQHKLDHFFSSVVHADRITHPKPDPEGFLLACQECGVQPENTVIVGDTVFDIQAGKNAKALATVGITHGFGSKADLVAAEPSYLASSIFEVSDILLKLRTV